GPPSTLARDLGCETLLAAPTLVLSVAGHLEWSDVHDAGLALNEGCVTLPASIGRAIETAVLGATTQAIVGSHIVAAAGVCFSHLVASGHDLLHARGTGSRRKREAGDDQGRDEGRNHEFVHRASHDPKRRRFVIWILSSLRVGSHPTEQPAQRRIPAASRPKAPALLFSCKRPQAARDCFLRRPENLRT